MELIVRGSIEFPSATNSIVENAIGQIWWKIYANLFKQTVIYIDTKLWIQTDFDEFEILMKKRSILTVNIRKKARPLSSISIFDRALLFYFIIIFFHKKMPIFYDHGSLFFPLLWPYSKKWYVFSIYDDNKKKLIRWERNLLPILLSCLRLPSSPLIFLFHIVFRQLPSRLHFIRDNIRKAFKAMRSYSRYIGYLKTKIFNCLRILIENSFSCSLWGFIVLSILLSDN